MIGIRRRDRLQRTVSINIVLLRIGYLTMVFMFQPTLVASKR